MLHYTTRYSMEIAPEKELKMIWKSRVTLLKILTQQGCDTTSYDISWEEFEAWAGNDDMRTNKDAMTLVLDSPKIQGPFAKIMIIWLADSKLGENIQNVLWKMEKEACNRSIVVVNDGVTPSATALIRNLNRQKIRIETSLLKELQFAVADHEYVPKHEICTAKAKHSILRAYGVKPSQLPAIKIGDPAIKHLGASKNQLIKIVRDSDTQPGKKVITFRTVV